MAAGLSSRSKPLAAQRNIEICYHSREQLARISRNSKQDQGVACDIHCQGYEPYEQALEQLPVAGQQPLIALWMVLPTHRIWV